MLYTLITTAYQPSFSAELKLWIKSHINPSMINANLDDKEASYFLDTIVEEVPSLSEEDQAIITELQLKSVEYVEF